MLQEKFLPNLISEHKLNFWYCTLKSGLIYSVIGYDLNVSILLFQFKGFKKKIILVGIFGSIISFVFLVSLVQDCPGLNPTRMKEKKKKKRIIPERKKNGTSFQDQSIIGTQNQH